MKVKIKQNEREREQLETELKIINKRIKQFQFFDTIKGDWDVMVKDLESLYNAKNKLILELREYPTKNVGEN